MISKPIEVFRKRHLASQVRSPKVNLQLLSKASSPSFKSNSSLAVLESHADGTFTLGCQAEHLNFKSVGFGEANQQSTRNNAIQAMMMVNWWMVNKGW